MERDKQGRFIKGLVPWNKGREPTDGEMEHLREIGFQKGNVPWNKEKTGLQAAWNKGNTKLPLNKLHDLYCKEGMTLEEIAASSLSSSGLTRTGVMLATGLLS